MRFALFGNIYQAKKSALVKRLLCALEEREAEVYVDRSFCEYLTRQLQFDLQPAGLIDGNQFEADYAVSMGGDGTFLQTASRVGDKGIPIIGVNTGRLGFLADVSGEEIEQTVQGIYDGNFHIESRSVLQVEYGNGGEWRVESGERNVFPYALNEVAVLKRDNSSMISIRVDINGEYLTTYQADGLIVNTPTGSTGYALSVGGPIMSPLSGALGLVPVAPHSLNVRPLMICDNQHVTLSVESRNHHFLVSIDGRSETCREGIRLHVRRAPYDICVLRRSEGSFFHTLRSKLMWGNDLRSDIGDRQNQTEE